MQGKQYNLDYFELSINEKNELLKLYLQKNSTISYTRPPIYRSELLLQTSPSAYEKADYDIDKLFRISDNTFFATYEYQIKSNGQSLLNKLNQSFAEYKETLKEKLIIEYDEFMRGYPGTYINVNTINRIPEKSCMMMI